jgi:nitrate reductase (cytochrome)
MNRRELLKQSAMAAATLALAGRSAEAGPASPFMRVEAGVQWDKAPCRFCGTGCHVQVGVKGGRVVAVA